jgi:hypothetical protein
MRPAGNVPPGTPEQPSPALPPAGELRALHDEVRVLAERLRPAGRSPYEGSRTDTGRS